MIQSGVLGLLENDLRLVEQRLLSVTPSAAPELDGILTDLIHAGGKRLRPALLLLSARVNRYDPSQLLDGAAAIELLHTATLVHDDTIDEAPTRRGRPTVNAAVSDRAAVLVGDYIFAQSALFAARTGRPRVVEVFARTLSEIVDGELRQILHRRGMPISRAEYERRAYSKTAALFSCACEIGAILSDAPEQHVRILRTYGAKLGLAFQVVDDVLDFSSTAEQMGKPVGHDLQLGLATLPTIIYLDTYAGDPAGASTVLAALSTGEPDVCAAAVEIIRASGAVRAAMDEAAALADQARAALLDLPASDARNALVDMVEQAVNRDR